MAKTKKKPAFPMTPQTGGSSFGPKSPMPPTAGGGFGSPMAKGPVAGSPKPNPFAKKKGK